MEKLFALDAKRRDAILNAALKEFTSKGYENASTNIISKEAGMTKALMFHYVSSKRKLFFAVYYYFSNLMEKEYFEMMNYKERDIFKRLRQSYILQVKLLEKHPGILELKKLQDLSIFNELQDVSKSKKHYLDCYLAIFDNIDEKKFKKKLDIEKSKEIIYWANVGFTNKILSELTNHNERTSNSDSIMKLIDEYLKELRKLFYKK